MYSLQKNKKITLIIYTYMHISQLYQFYTYKYIYLKYSMNILCTSNHICFCRRVVLYVLFMYIYICVHGRSFLNFRFVIFQQRIPEKGHRRSPRSYRRRILYCKSRRSRGPKKHSPPGQGQQQRRQSFCDIIYSIA